MSHEADGDEDEPCSTPETLYDLETGISVAPGLERGWEVPPGPEPEDAVLAAPRLLLSLPRGALQLVFWPLQKLIWVTERYKIIEYIERVLYWNEAQTLGWNPVISYGSGVGFSFGANVFHKDLFGYDESLRLAVRFGGRFNQGYEVRFHGDRIGGSRLWLDTRVRFEINPKLYFAGIGMPQTDLPGIVPVGPTETAVETRYHQQRFLGLLRVGTTMGPRGKQIQTGVTAIFNRREFGPAATTDHSIEEIYDTARIPGFDGGVTELELNGTLIVDIRANRGLDSTGVVFEAFGGGAPPLNGYAYLHYGMEFVGTINLYRRTRLLSLRAAIEAVHGPGEEIPFTALPRLGGADRLRGYDEDQFRDEKFALASIEYHYPIHQNVLGELFIDAGYVAADYETLFGDIPRWKLGGGGGLIIGSADSVLLRFELSYGDGLHFFLSTDLAAAFDGRSSRL